MALLVTTTKFPHSSPHSLPSSKPTFVEVFQELAPPATGVWVTDTWMAGSLLTQRKSVRFSREDQSGLGAG